ncbi:hypothetical protein SCAR479_11120 [Seiridium cardinale]|uniref:Uncharacterized protein n=1 Tax=Seiridium cardinale TaxID=138064 RepID=A0ABR2XF03_9PEZI
MCTGRLATPAELADQAIKDRLVPDCGYNWHAFLTAIYQRNHIESISAKDASPDVARCESAYEAYIPRWTDPNFREDQAIVSSDWGYAERPERDALGRLRPALMLHDAQRNPTAYAKRWGIHPDQSGGRSRLSPANAAERKRLAVLQFQLDHQTDAVKNLLATETTRKKLVAFLKVNGQLAVSDQEFESWKTQNINEALPAITGSATLSQDPMKVDTSGLDDGTKRFYAELREEIEDDQDWQRLLFSGLTTDELIAENIHTMSNEESNNLDMSQPLHILFTRNKWLDQSTFGSTKHDPRLFYTINGSPRKEWNVSKNDEIWDILQPSLQIASRILHQNPPVWQALKDLRTRQPILDDDLDPRTNKRANTTPLMRMVPIGAIDIDECPEPVQLLCRDLGFNTVQRIDELLVQNLRFFIGAGHNSPEAYNTDGKFGSTRFNPKVPGQVIVDISAEMIWPLLVNEYSSSEKLCCHFMIAVTLLHELMHATHNMVATMCAIPNKNHPAGQLAAVSNLLDRIGKEVLDKDNVYQEPYYKDSFWTELGNLFEYETFGMSFGALPLTDNASTMITLQPIALVGYSYPTVFADANVYLNVDEPIVDFCQPIRIDWIHRFFQQKFWDTEIKQWGLDILKLTPQKMNSFTLMSYDWFNDSVMEELFGQDNYDFFRTVWQFLHRTGMPILGDYLRYSLWDVRSLVMIKTRLHAEFMQRWDHLDSEIDIDPLPRALESFYVATTLGRRVIASIADGDSVNAQRDWLNAMPRQRAVFNHESNAAWVARMETYFDAAFLEGGSILQHVIYLYGIYQREVGKLQRYAHEYFSQDREGREYLWPSDGYTAHFDWVWSALGTYTKTVRDLSGLLDSIAQHSCIQPLRCSTTYSVWAARFKTIYIHAKTLHDALTADGTHKLSNVQINMVLSGIRVPSSATKSKVQQLQKLAMREFNLVTLGIRNTVTEFIIRVDRFRQSPTTTSFSSIPEYARDPLPDFSVINLNEVADAFRCNDHLTGIIMAGAFMTRPLESSIAKLLDHPWPFRNLESITSLTFDRKSLKEQSIPTRRTISGRIMRSSLPSYKQ